MRIMGKNADGEIVWMTGEGFWTNHEHMAGEFKEREAQLRLRVINANNRFLDRDDRVEASLEPI